MAETEHKVNVIGDRPTGQIRISDEVVAIITDLAISDVKGILTVGNRKNKRSYGKGIGIRMEGSDVYVDITLALKKGVKLKDVAVLVQEKVKNSIENMLDMDVKEVNISVVSIQKEKSETEE